MFRRQRASEPDPVSRNLGNILKPMRIMIWGGQAMHYLGVPLVLGVSTEDLGPPLWIKLISVWVYTIVVNDEDYQPAIQKLIDSGFQPSKPRREPAPEILESLPDPQALIDEINSGYRRLNEATTTFDYPRNSLTSELPEGTIEESQLTLLPNSFTHLPPLNDPQYSNDYIVHDNIWFPCERALASSFIQAAIDDEDVNQYSRWINVLHSWISFMIGYLEVNNDIFDDWRLLDERAKEWFSQNYGRAHEEKFGPWDRRISKRLGTDKEMPVDARGHAVN